MNWDAIGAVGEILGAIAVVATLGYLAIQTRHSVAATQANTRQAILDSDQQFLSNLVLDPGLDEIRWKPDLSDDEKRRLGYFCITFLRMRESNWLQFQNGGLDRVTWESYRASILSVMNNPNGRNFWRNYAAVEGFLNATFVSEVEALLEHAPVVEKSALLTAFDGE